MEYALQSDRKVIPTMLPYRAMTEPEVRALRSGQSVSLVLNNGRVGSVRLNGKVRTWKRDATRLEIPIKYGLYEFATFSLSEALARFVVELA